MQNLSARSAALTVSLLLHKRTQYKSAYAAFADIFGASNVKAAWDSALQAAVTAGAITSWVDQKNGWNKTPPVAAPVYAADGTNFRGRNVISCASSGNKNLSYTSGGTIFAATDRPAIILVGRARTAASGLWVLGSPNSAIQLQPNAATTGRMLCSITPSGFPSASFTYDLLQHMYLGGRSSTQVLGQVDGVAMTPSTSSADFNNAITSLTTGGPLLGVTATDWTVAFEGYLNSYPSAIAIARWRAFCRSWYGTP